MFTIIAELERNAYWWFYKTKRCSAYTLEKQIFEVCAGVSFHCEIGDIFKNIIFLQNTSGCCFWSVSCSNSKVWGTASTAFVASRYSSYFIWRSYYTNYQFDHSKKYEQSVLNSFHDNYNVAEIWNWKQPLKGLLNVHWQKCVHKMWVNSEAFFLQKRQKIEERRFYENNWSFFCFFPIKSYWHIYWIIYNIQ